MAQVRWSLTAGTIFRTSKTLSPATPSSMRSPSLIVSLNLPKLSSRLPGSVEWFQSLIALTFENYSLRSYRIVYLLQDDEACILRVVHGSRDLLALVRREPWEIGG